MRKLTQVTQSAKNLARLAPANREPRTALRLITETLMPLISGGGGVNPDEPTTTITHG